MRAAALLTAVLLANPAQADVRIHEERDAVSLPYTEWELSFPGTGWVLDQQRRAGDGSQFYYMLHNANYGLVVSFFLEPAYKCADGPACRTLFWKNGNPGAGYLEPKELRRLEVNRFAVLEFTTRFATLEQLHWTAHLVHDGVWIDMHLSSMTAKDGAGHQGFTERLTVSQKALCPECVKTKGLSRQESSILFAKARTGDKAAWSRIEELAGGGDAEAQFMAGRLNSWGTPLIKPDEKRSVAWVTKAAEQGHAEAQSNLAFFHISGRGMEKKDVQAAVQWWTKSGEQGFAPAQFSLANAYSTEETIKNDAKAFEWTQRAAKQGFALAQLNLGVIYGRGVGTARDLPAAVDWYRKAMVQGNENAMVNMAAIYGLAGDPQLARNALVILDEPVLVSNERAKTLKAKICADNPGLCPAKAGGKP